MQRKLAVAVLLCSQLFWAQGACGTDHFVTLAGGYEPSGNQASLEANVLFFREVLIESHGKARSETTFFADGYDDKADLQVAVDTPDGPLAEFLSRLHNRGGPPVEYRNHQIANLAGPLRTENIRGSLQRLATSLTNGDRLIVYVTAHGEAAEEDGSYNTFISCWNEQRFSAAEFTDWLDKVPAQIPVVLVMAQCYCGGFSHTIFRDADAKLGMDNHLRCGFFAQQHDLPAAGCRPDIENDEEYSSYFWGAFVGHSRMGRPLLDVDCNGDGRVSFAEAHAQAVIACDSIDIPLRTSEALLRRYSRIRGYEHRGVSRELLVSDEDGDNEDGTDSTVLDGVPPIEGPGATDELHAMQGSIEELITTARPDVQASVRALCKQLNLSITADVTAVFEAFSHYDEEFSQVRRQANRMRRGRWRERGRERSSSTRELRQAMAEKWPELADRHEWRSSPLLAEDKQAEVLESLASLPGFEEVSQALAERAELGVKLDDMEIRSIKYERLIGLLESQVLARNLPQVAPQVVEAYRNVVRLEEGTLKP